MTNFMMDASNIPPQPPSIDGTVCSAEQTNAESPKSKSSSMQPPRDSGTKDTTESPSRRSTDGDVAATTASEAKIPATHPPTSLVAALSSAAGATARAAPPARPSSLSSKSRYSLAAAQQQQAGRGGNAAGKPHHAYFASSEVS